MQWAEAERVMGKSLASETFVGQHVKRCLDLFFRDPPAAATASMAAPAKKARRPAVSRQPSGVTRTRSPWSSPPQRQIAKAAPTPVPAGVRYSAW